MTRTTEQRRRYYVDQLPSGKWVVVDSDGVVVGGPYDTERQARGEAIDLRGIQDLHDESVDQGVSRLLGEERGRTFEDLLEAMSSWADKYDLYIMVDGDDIRDETRTITIENESNGWVEITGLGDGTVDVRRDGGGSVTLPVSEITAIQGAVRRVLL